jgi:hypothetical protein
MIRFRLFQGGCRESQLLLPTLRRVEHEEHSASGAFDLDLGENLSSRSMPEESPQDLDFLF